jgi:hypothetical protein
MIRRAGEWLRGRLGGDPASGGGAGRPWAALAVVIFLGLVPPLWWTSLKEMEIWRVTMSAAMGADPAWWDRLASLTNGWVAMAALKGWMALGASFRSDAGLRVASVCITLALVAVVHRAVAVSAGAWAARFAAGFVAGSALVVEYARDARCYTLHPLLVFVAVWAATRALSTPGARHAALAAAAGALAIHNHLMATPFLAAAALAAALVPGAPARGRWRAVGGLLAGLALGAPWMLALVPRAAPLADIPPPKLKWWLNVANDFGNGALLPLALVAIVAVPAWRGLLRRASPDEGAGARGAATVALAAAGLGVAALFVFGLVVMPVGRDRYYLPAVPLLALALGAFGQARGPALRAVMASCGVVLPIVFLSLGALDATVAGPGRAAGDVAAVVAEARRAGARGVVVAAPAFKEMAVRRYWPDGGAIDLDAHLDPAAPRPAGEVTALVWTADCELPSSVRACARLRAEIAADPAAQRLFRDARAEIWRYRAPAVPPP